MKRTILVILATFLIVNNLFSQGDIKYSLKILNKNSNPVSNLEITALETSTFKKVKGLTNSNGIIAFELRNGNEWSISIGEIKQVYLVSSVPGSIMEINEIYVYDPTDYKRKMKQDNSRTNKGFKTIEQNVRVTDKFNKPNCMLIVKVKHPNGNKLSDVNVGIVNTKDSIIYRSKTNYQGEAYFIIPNNNNYEIDINDFKNYTYSDFGEEYSKRSMTIQYAPTIVNENEVNDTIYQKALISDGPTSERALVKVIVQGGKKNGIDETIFLRQLKTGKVYTTKTNNQGFAIFLIPIHYIYMIDFQNQKNVDAINIKDAKKMTQVEINVHYMPDPRLEYPEKFIPTTDNLLIKSFNTFLEKQFEKPKDKPLYLKIFSAKKINKNSKEALFRLTLTSSNEYGKGIRLPLNAAFVLDKSGSMYCCERSESLKKSLWAIGNTLTNEDNVSVVLFDDDTFTVQQTLKNHLDGFQTIIENYNPSGGTNIYSGIQAGVKNILKYYDVNKSNRIFILTDGYGVTPPKEITDYVSLKSQEGIEFSAIGLGNDFNQSLLELIAREGNGTFNYVYNADDLSEIFLDELKKTFNYIVKDLKIEMYFDENLIFSNLYGYPVNTETQDMISFNIGKIPGNTNQIAYLKFKLNDPSVEIESKPLVVKVSYFDIVKDLPISYEEKIYLTWTDETDTELLLDQEEKKLYAIAILNQSLKVMAEAYENEDIITAKEALKQGVSQIEEIFPDAKPKDVKTLLDDAYNYIMLLKQIQTNER
jgi:hypothetical protein